MYQQTEGFTKNFEMILAFVIVGAFIGVIVYLFPQQFTAAFQNLCANLVAHLHMRF